MEKTSQTLRMRGFIFLGQEGNEWLNSVQVRKGIQPDALVIMPKHEDQAVMAPIIFYIPMPITEAP